MEQHKIIWRGIALTITFKPDWLNVADHIELETEGRVPLPVTETGYRSHFMPVGSVMAYGGPVTYVTDWLEAEAKRMGWSGAQLSLF
jgi:hypothetical protein